MKILKNFEVPTGNILVVSGNKGNLECLSIGDYGKDVNLKCDAMGLTRNIEQVSHTEMLPLSEKWVITISSQYGCSMNCKFCDVPKVGPGLNATTGDLINQVLAGMSLHPEVTESKRLNIHYARMGEPTWNRNVLESAKILREMFNDEYLVHPVVSTIMPRGFEGLNLFIAEWTWIKTNIYNGNAGLQLSINSTDEKEREEMFSGNALTLPEISELMKNYAKPPKGRKYTLNFAVANYTVNAEYLAELFNPEHYIIKLTPMHKTKTAIENDIKTLGDYTTMHPYIELEENLKKAGFDVLVFIASEAEDLGLITCGNAILSGSLPKVPYILKGV